VVIGVSTGGISALKILLGGLGADFPLPVLVVTHIMPEADDGLAVLLNTTCAVRVKEAEEQEMIEAGTVYLAPANYHLLLERDGRLALSIDPPVNFARPSVDVLFESAAQAFASGVIGIILTGAGSDGSRGLQRVKQKGGFAIVQAPAEAEMDAMPRSALALITPDRIEPLQGISSLLPQLAGGRSTTS
jgi:two-component system chemotaxis response regulator CheB